MNGAVSANDDYEALLRSAERICAVHQYEPQDTVVFVPAGRKMSHPVSEDLLPLSGTETSFPLQVEVPLAEEELSPSQKDICIACLRALLSKDPQAAPVFETLGHIGSNYQADRVYTLALIEDRRAVRVLQEWAVTNFRGIKLQKLLFFIQGWHLGLIGDPLFENDFEA